MSTSNIVRDLFNRHADAQVQLGLLLNDPTTPKHRIQLAAVRVEICNDRFIEAECRYVENNPSYEKQGSLDSGSWKNALEQREHCTLPALPDDHDSYELPGMGSRRSTRKTTSDRLDDVTPECFCKAGAGR